MYLLLVRPLGFPKEPEKAAFPQFQALFQVLCSRILFALRETTMMDDDGDFELWFPAPVVLSISATFCYGDAIL